VNVTVCPAVIVSDFGVNASFLIWTAGASDADAVVPATKAAKTGRKKYFMPVVRQNVTIGWGL
jgi:hypothetical protein